MALVINPTIYDEVDQRASLFQQAKPFPHVVIDNFLDEEVALGLLQDFPDISEMYSSRVYMFGDKYELASMEKASPLFALVREELLSERFTQFISKIKGENIFVDHEFYGCGINQTCKDGFLDMHTDLNAHPSYENWLHCFNIMIYLNKDWKPEYGGELCLRHGLKGPVVEIPPLFNRCVMMQSDDTTYHGYRRMPLPEGITRKAIVAFTYKEEALDRMPPRKVVTWDPQQSSILKRVIAPFFSPLVVLKNRFLGSRTIHHR